MKRERFGHAGAKAVQLQLPAHPAFRAEGDLTAVTFPLEPQVLGTYALRTLDDAKGRADGR